MGTAQSMFCLESATAPPVAQRTAGPVVTRSEDVDQREKRLQLGMIPTNNQCMLIGSYGDQYSAKVKADVVPKKSDKPGGKFLCGVSDDLEIIQDLIRSDPCKNLAYVLPDVPGAQRSAASYLSKIEKLLKESHDCGVLIWYTGHGQRNTGNWCFKDGKISFDQIFHLYEKFFRGKVLTIVSDCCYSGQWVHKFAEIMDAKGIQACGHKAKEAGYLIKVFASCLPKEGAWDTYYVKKSVFIDPERSLIMFNQGPIGIGDKTQTAIWIDSTRTRCFSQSDKPCKIDEIPPRASWKWMDFADFNRSRVLQKSLFRIWSKESAKYWRFLIVYKDMFDEFCTLFKTTWPENIDCDRYGYTVFHGPGEDPPEDVYDAFTKLGPVAVKLPKSRPTSITAVHP